MAESETPLFPNFTQIVDNPPYRKNFAHLATELDASTNVTIGIRVITLAGYRSAVESKIVIQIEPATIEQHATMLGNTKSRNKSIALWSFSAVTTVLFAIGIAYRRYTRRRYVHDPTASLYATPQANEPQTISSLSEDNTSLLPK